MVENYLNKKTFWIKKKKKTTYYEMGFVNYFGNILCTSHLTTSALGFLIPPLPPQYLAAVKWETPENFFFFLLFQIKKKKTQPDQMQITSAH